MFAFTDPNAQNPVLVVCSPNARLNALISMGSPTWVPVPCASIAVIVCASTWLAARALAINRCCPATDGAV